VLMVLSVRSYYKWVVFMAFKDGIRSYSWVLIVFVS
jgi:hypothetical protein